MTGTPGVGAEPDLVSVVLPVYNGDRWLAEAIDSVLGQTYRPLELIVVDDGSSDGSSGILVRSPQVISIHQANAGCAVARNRGIAAARGAFIAFIDQDDRWTPGKLAIQVEHLRTHPELGYVLGRQRTFLEPGFSKPSWLVAALLDRPHAGYLPGTLLVRRTTLDEVGHFDPSLRIGSDTDWFLRARDAGVGMAVVDAIVLEKRVHDANLSADPASSDELLRMMHASLRRRRAAVDA